MAKNKDIIEMLQAYDPEADVLADIKHAGVSKVGGTSTFKVRAEIRTVSDGIGKAPVLVVGAQPVKE